LPACLAVVAALVTGSPLAHADEPSTVPSLRWDPAWTHAGPADYVLTGAGVGGLLLEAAFVEPKQPPLRWTGPILFDGAVRRLLRGSTAEVRADATTASWALLGLAVAYPVVVDVPYAWKRYGPTVAWDLFWQDAVALSLVSATDMAVRDLAGRARPEVSDCLASGGSTTQCLGNNNEATRSFPGGHVAIATTGTVLVCMQHLSLHLYGDPWDALTCAAAIVNDAADGTLRIVTDNHWATDIVAGGVLGLAIGWGMPVVMHLHKPAASQPPSAALLPPVPMVVNHGAGLGVSGWF